MSIYTPTPHTTSPLLLAGARGNRVTLWTWDGEYAQAVQAFPHSKQINALACSPDGSSIACAGEGGTLSLWGVRGGYTQWMQEFSAPIAALSWSSRGLLAIAGGKDVFLAHQEGMTPDWVSHSSLVTSVAWSPDGDALASGGRDGLRLWSHSSVAPRAQHLMESIEIATLAWSSEGLLAAGERRKSSTMAHLLVFDGEFDDDALQRRYVAHTRTVDALAWSPDGTRLASAGASLVRIWNHQRHECVLALSCPEVSSLAWSPDGIWLATSGRQGVQIWEAETGHMWMFLPPDREHDLPGPITWMNALDTSK